LKLAALPDEELRALGGSLLEGEEPDGRFGQAPTHQPRDAEATRRHASMVSGVAL
jgi:hypothetical protein